MSILTIDEFKEQMIKLEHYNHARRITLSIMKHWDSETQRVMNEAHQEMMSKLNDDTELGKMYLQYISSK